MIDKERFNFFINFLLFGSLLLIVILLLMIMILFLRNYANLTAIDWAMDKWWGGVIVLLIAFILTFWGANKLYKITSYLSLPNRIGEN